MPLAKGFSFVVAFLFLILPLTASAQLDTTFGIGGRMERTLPGTQTSLKPLLLPDGKILVLTYNAIQGPQPWFSLVRYNSNGTVDTSYGVNGDAQLAIPFTTICCSSWGIRDAVRQPDGKIVIVGSDRDGLVMRVNADGTVDNSFSGDGIDRPNINGTTAPDEIHSVFYQSDGKLVVAGITYSQPAQLFLMRYDASGNPDTTYGVQGGAIVHSLGFPPMDAGRQADGRLVVFVGGRIYRFNNDGSMDNTFVSPTFSYSGDAWKLLVLSNDKMLVADTISFTDQTLRPQSDIRVRGFNSDGTVDNSFGASGLASIDVSHLMPDRLLGIGQKPDGSVVIAAQTDVDPNRSAFGGGYLSLAQIDSVGSVTGRYLSTARSLFLSSAGSGDVLIQPDGKVVVATYMAFDNDQNHYDVFLSRHVGIPLDSYRFRGVPLDAGYNNTLPATGKSSPAVRRPGNNHWWLSGVTVGPVGSSGDIPVPSDFVRSFGVDASFFRPSTGTWYISTSSYFQPLNFMTVPWGLAGDIPVAYDYEGDGKSDIAVFRPSNGTWYIRHGSDGSYRVSQWGLDGDKPVVGDYDGDGLGDLAVWRPSSGIWYIARSSDAGYTSVQFGISGDIPVQEDYDGDKKTDIAVWRPSTGVWYIWRSADSGFTILPFGLSGDVPTPGDYDGDQKTDISVVRSTTWYQQLSGTNSVVQFQYGLAGDIPLAGRY